METVIETPLSKNTAASPVIQNLLYEQAALFTKTVDSTGKYKNWLILGGVVVIILMIVKKVG